MKIKSGEAVINRHNSHIHANVLEHLPSALACIHSQQRPFIEEEVIFPATIGQTICVCTGPDDDIVYAKRPNRNGFSRFVKNREPEPCASVVVVLKAGGPGTYVLITAFIGRKPEPEPWDEGNFMKKPDPNAARRRSRQFWDTHALVWGLEPVIEGSETDNCPW